MAIGSYRFEHNTPEAKRVQRAALRGALRAKQRGRDPHRCSSCQQALGVLDMKDCDVRLVCENIDCPRWGL